AGGIAHDFNNILTAILGNFNLAILDKDLNSRTKNLLVNAEKACWRAQGLTQQLLTFAKGGEPVKETSPLDLVIRDSAGFVLSGDTVACRYDIPDDLWMVEIDRGQISQVIQNIVLNASHATVGGGTIVISCENIKAIENELMSVKKGRFVKITIEDSGVGIPVKVIEKIFDPYFSTKQGGSGLGLAITQSIVGKHNGHLLVASVPGSGTTFTIYLPATDLGVGLVQGPTEVACSKVGKIKVLIMDDEESLRDVSKGMLTSLGHEVKLAEDGREAIELFEVAMASGDKFDLVILDLTVPGGIGGGDAAKEILACDPEAKLIVSSGYSNSPIMASCRDYGFCDAIVKPYSLEKLSGVIEKAFILD
ncbi:MAG: response regulator, partial [Desulfobulbaceae bacterium]|nr:response regulator [Desulfobulbaceae bacterium]